MKTSIWSAVTCRRFSRFGDLSPKQSRVQRSGRIERLLPFDGDKSPAESADKSAHSKAWIFPPLFELPSYLSGQTRHGRFFLLKTPDAGGGIYEIEVRQPKLRLRVVASADPKPRSEEAVTGFTVPTERVWERDGRPDYTQTVFKVSLEFKRTNSRE